MVEYLWASAFMVKVKAMNVKTKTKGTLIKDFMVVIFKGNNLDHTGYFLILILLASFTNSNYCYIYNNKYLARNFCNPQYY